jgi:outer membrane protein TolC
LTLVLGLVVGIAIVGQGIHAQFSDDERIDLTIPAVESKSFAKWKFEASAVAPRQLAKARLEAAREELDGRFKEFLAGRGTQSFLEDSAQHVLQAELELAETPAAIVAAHERHWIYTKEIEEIDRARFEAGRIPIQDYAQARYYRLDAELRWVEAKAKLEKK